jgi:DNA modification methylase
MVNNSCIAGGRVLDLFGGSGSTLIAAVKTGRVANLCEFEPKYAHVIVQRWVEFTGLEAYRLEEDGSKTAWSDIIAR